MGVDMTIMEVNTEPTNRWHILYCLLCGHRLVFNDDDHPECHNDECSLFGRKFTITLEVFVDPLKEFYHEFCGE